MEFEFAKKPGTDEVAYPYAALPGYSTPRSAGADFFCAEEVTINPIIFNGVDWKPTLVHTGVKAKFNNDVVLQLYNRSSNPMKLGLVLANSVGIIDSDYYGNPSNDGEIMFAYYNFSNKPVTLKVGDKVGQGLFVNILKASNIKTSQVERVGGFGSTGN